MKANNIQINNTQFWCILACLTWPGLITYGSGIAARAAGRDMWLGGIIALVTTLLFVCIVVYIGKKFPDETLVQLSEKILGKFLGKIIGIILILYFLMAATISASIYIHHLSGYLLPETPFWVLVAMHFIVLTFFIWQGPEVIARVSVIAFATILVFFVLVLIASLSDLKFTRIMPFLNTSLVNIGISSIKIDNFTGQNLFVIGMLLPLVNNRKKSMHSALFGVLIGGFFYMTLFLALIFVMGPHLIQILRIPSMDFVRSVQITQYLHRFESFFVALWYWSMLTQTGILLYCAATAFKQTIGIKNYNWISLGLGLLTGVLTYFLAADLVTFLYFIENLWYYIFPPLQFGLPLILLPFSFFRKQKKTAT